jgi:hypothetical protein
MCMTFNVVLGSDHLVAPALLVFFMVLHSTFQGWAKILPKQ